jgi:hypothetical protein
MSDLVDKLREGWRWFTLADVPTARREHAQTPTPMCGWCPRAATCHITFVDHGQRREHHSCGDHLADLVRDAPGTTRESK